MSAHRAPRPLPEKDGDQWADFQRIMLLVFGCMWIARGVQVYLEPAEAIPAWAILHERLPMCVRALLWVATGMVSLLGAVLRRQPMGLAAAAIMPAERTVSYGWSALMWLAPGDPPGHLASAAWAAWWLGITVAVLLTACWPLAIQRHPKRRRL